MKMKPENSTPTPQPAAGHTPKNLKIAVKFLKGVGIYAFFKGPKNVGSSNTPDVKEAVAIAQKRFPGATLVIKDFYK